MFLSIDFDFCRKYLDIESLKISSDVIYLVDANLVIKGYNKAYIDFALKNNGEAILKHFLLGASVANLSKEPLKNFLRNAYRHAIETNKIFEHEYLCPSPSQQRLFRQTAYPIVKKSGLVITNHLVEQIDITSDPISCQEHIINNQGVIVQCQNCRKIRNPVNTTMWVWVPSLVEKIPKNVSHSICPYCLDHFYPDLALD